MAYSSTSDGLELDAMPCAHTLNAWTTPNLRTIRSPPRSSFIQTFAYQAAYDFGRAVRQPKKPSPDISKGDGWPEAVIASGEDFFFYAPATRFYASEND
jgi:hypothetical protein